VNDLMLAFVAPPQGLPGLEIRVNFGVFASREATAAEIDDLATTLIPDVGEVTIVAEQRHELSGDAEAALHQVRVEIDEENLPEDPDERESLAELLCERCTMWARRAIDERRVDV
jgi:hypothetical protein